MTYERELIDQLLDKVAAMAAEIASLTSDVEFYKSEMAYWHERHNVLRDNPFINQAPAYVKKTPAQVWNDMLTTQEREQVLNVYREKGAIPAIKAIRETSGVGLAEAKDAYDAFVKI